LPGGRCRGGDRGGAGGEGGRAGHRRIAALLGRPPETVRGWLRRFAGRVEAVRAVSTRWCQALNPDPVLHGPAGSAWADAIAAVTACLSARGPLRRRGGGLAGRGSGVGGAAAGAELATRTDKS
jgi:hypothetical protein